ADQGCVDVVVGQELPGDTGVLGGDKVHLFQHPEGPQGDILQVADGGPHHVKAPRFTGHGPALPRTPARPAGPAPAAAGPVPGPTGTPPGAPARARSARPDWAAGGRPAPLGRTRRNARPGCGSPAGPRGPLPPEPPPDHPAPPALRPGPAGARQARPEGPPPRPGPPPAAPSAVPGPGPTPAPAPLGRPPGAVRSRSRHPLAQSAPGPPAHPAPPHRS